VEGKISFRPAVVVCLGERKEISITSRAQLSRRLLGALLLCCFGKSQRVAFIKPEPLSHHKALLIFASFSISFWALSVNY
jgi:hypothetical protein